MTRPITDGEDDLSRLWGLVGELTEQLESNRAIVNQLKAQSGNVKGQAAHVGTGFPLRRFNLDISDEEYSSELEAFSAHLVLENQQLQHENKQLNGLLKEYEQTLESVMGKFRGVAHASQQHDISLHSYYTSLLQTLQTAHSSAHLHDNTSLSLLLHRLSTLLRSALRALGGEDAEIDLESHLPGLLALSNGQSSIGRSSSDPSSSPPSSPTKSSSSGRKSVVQRAPARPPRFPGSIPGSSGGYIGTEGQGDWAMEREMEITRLEEENAALREMLRIAQEGNDEIDEKEELKAEEQEPGPSTAGRRKSSLTIQELELGAEKEAEEQKRSGIVFSPLSAVKEGTEERLEKVPDGNTGLAEHVKAAQPRMEAESAAPVLDVADAGKPLAANSALGLQAGPENGGVEHSGR